MKSVGRSKGKTKLRKASSKANLSLKKKRGSGGGPQAKSLREAVMAGDFMSASLHIAQARTSEKEAPQLNSLDEWGWTLLHTALVGDNVAMATMLVDAGADVKSKTPEGDTTLHLLLSTQDLKDVRVAQDVDLVLGVLLEHDADVLAVNKDGNSALHLACRVGYSHGIKLLLESKADVNIVNSHGETALHEAALNKQLDAIEQLLQSPVADCSVKGRGDMTPLEIALNSGWDEGIAALEERSPPPGPIKASGAEEPIVAPFLKCPDDLKDSIRIYFGTTEAPQGSFSNPAQRYREDFFQRAHDLWYRKEPFAVLAVHKRSDHWMRFSSDGLMSGSLKHDQQGWLPVPQKAFYLMKAALMAMEAKIGQTKTFSVGVLFGDPQQSTEEQMAENPWNDHYAEVVNVLQDEPGYVSWKGYEATLHVAPKMSADERRRLIGNDRVLLYILTGDRPLVTSFRGNVNGFAVVIRERADGLFDVGAFHRARVSAAPEFQRKPRSLKELPGVVLPLLISGNYAVNTSPPYTVTLKKLAQAELAEMAAAFQELLQQPKP